MNQSKERNSASFILELERRNMMLSRAIHKETQELRELDSEIEAIQEKIVTERKKQSEFAPPGSALKRAGASNLAFELKKYQKRQMEDLEKELARSRRIVDETTRVVAEKREEINLLRKQAMVLNDEFLRRSNELDRSKMQLAIMLEQANQIVKAKQYVGEQMDELKAEAARDKEAWHAEREAVLSEIKILVERLQDDSPKRKKHGYGGLMETNSWGDLDPESEQQAIDRTKQLDAEIQALESVAPAAEAGLTVWEIAFSKLAEATGEPDTESLVSNFLKQDEANYQIFLEVSLLNEEIESLSQQLAEVRNEIEKTRDSQKEVREAQLNSLRQTLRTTELAVDDAAERERALVTHLHAVAEKIVALYKIMNCTSAVNDWSKASRANIRRQHHQIILETEADNKTQDDNEDSEEQTTTVPVKPAAAPQQAHQHASDDSERSSPRTGTDDAWKMLGPDVALSREDGDATTARQGAVVRSRRSSTPPRSLMEFAGLTGNQRGEGLRVLLAEKRKAGEEYDPQLGLATPAAVEAARAASSATAEEEEKRSKDGGSKMPPGPPARPKTPLLRPPVPAISAVENVRAEGKQESDTPSVDTPKQGGDSDTSRSGATPQAGAAASDDGRKSGAMLKRLPSWMAKRGGPEPSQATPATPLWELIKQQTAEGGSASPLFKAMSAAMILSEELQPAKVPTETVRQYLLILERRMQEICAEFDSMALADATVVSPSRFGVKGPGIEHDNERHAFHIEPPEMEEYQEDNDVAILSTLHNNFVTLKKNRRASLASIVDGVPTMPQGATTAILTMQDMGHPVVVPRPGTTYVQENNAALIAESSQRLAEGRKRSSVTGPPASPTLSSRGSPRGVARPATSHNLTHHPTASPLRSRSGSPLRSVQSERFLVGTSRPTTANFEPAEPSLHLVERSTGSLQLNSHGRGRVILPGALPNNVAPSKREEYREWIAGQKPNSENAEVLKVLTAANRNASRSLLSADDDDRGGSIAALEGSPMSRRSYNHFPASSVDDSERQSTASPLGPSAAPHPSDGRTLGPSAVLLPSDVTTMDADATMRSELPRIQAASPVLNRSNSQNASRVPRYPKTMYSGFKLKTISNYSGAGSAKAYANYNTQTANAARQRIQTANISSGALTVPQPADRDALLRDVKRQYGELSALPSESDDGEDVSPAAMHRDRSNTVLAFIHAGKFNEEEYKERQRQKEIDARRAARRRSFEQLEATMNSVKKAAQKLSIAEAHKDAYKAVGVVEGDAERPTPTILGAIAVAKRNSLQGASLMPAEPKPSIVVASRGSLRSDSSKSPVRSPLRGTVTDIPVVPE